MIATSLKRNGPFRLAAWSSLADASVFESLLRAPFDAIVIDMQQGLHDTRSVHGSVARAALFGRPSIVRVPVGDLAFVSRALDFGATAVILPMIDSVDDARALVEAAKYPPLGKRSYGPGRAAEVTGFASGRAYMDAANDSTMALAMIETPEAFRGLDAILAVDGLDGVFIGPSDLSIALTGRLDPDGAETVAAAALRAREAGYDLVGISSDAAMLTQAAHALARSVPR